MECTICSEKWNLEVVPALLDCGHVLCLQCCRKLYDQYNGEIPCPSCRKRTPTHPDDLNTSLTLQQMARLRGSVPDREESKTFQVMVLNLSGHNICYQATKDWRVRDLKARIAESEGIPPNVQRLIYGGKQMTDDETLGSYGIRSTSTIHLAMRLQG